MPSKGPTESEQRQRDVRLWWERDPKGPILPRLEGASSRKSATAEAQRLLPVGERTPEGFVWAHKVDHLFWIQRIPSVNAVTIWSRTMLAEFGEGYADVRWDEPIVGPRVVRAWPVLRLPPGHPSRVNPPIGAIDRGCEHEHAEQVAYEIREGEPQAVQEQQDAGDVDVEMKDATAESSEAAPPEPAPGCQTAATSAEVSTTDEKPQASSSGKGKTRADPTGLFSVKGLPKLEELIPEEFFPDVLMVHDPDNATYQKTAQSKPIKYIRSYPALKRDGAEAVDDELRTAHLHLSKANRIGTGNHSYVYRAPLTLPPPLSAHSPTGQVTVAAKLSYQRCTAHDLLRNEAKVYDSFPKNIQEEYCGYDIVPPCRFPVPATAVVPKFFGYYLPVNERGDVLDNHHDNCSEDNPCDVSWPSPILLMEECGNPVEPSKFTVDQRTECFSLILRLHYLEIVQGSFYVRNIMIQPGPLSVPPERRSYDTPSFRIIDFGRGERWDWNARREGRQTYFAIRNDRRADFVHRIGDEAYRARKELLIEDFGF